MRINNNKKSNSQSTNGRISAGWVRVVGEEWEGSGLKIVVEKWGRGVKMGVMKAE